MTTTGELNADCLLNFLYGNKVELPKTKIEKPQKFTCLPGSEPPPKSKLPKRPKDSSYAAKYIREEEESITSQSTSSPRSPDLTDVSQNSQMSELEEASSIGDPTYLSSSTMIDDDTLNLYLQYGLMENHHFDPDLIITSERERILQLLVSYNVLIIQGPTGTGKTTQVPQYILQDCAMKNKECRIIVTQPRKIAAKSIAQRVCLERGWQLGELVGYQVALDNRTSASTRLTYATTGVFLRKIIAAKTLKPYTHIILDEVHERDSDIDFAMLVVRKFLRTNSKDVKVILMSATFDSERFANYFTLYFQGRQVPATVLDITRDSFKVYQYYAEDLEILGKIPEPDPSDPFIPPEAYQVVCKLIKGFDRIESNDARSAEEIKRGAVLVFLPGYHEIVELSQLLRRDAIEFKWWILHMHSSITMLEQNRVFEQPKCGQRKIILSTNICESSITVSDIKYVIDFCLTKTLVCDPDTNYTTLALAWASKANCIQRAGRAGRVSDGRCYRLVTEKFFREALPNYGTPEMKIAPLEKTVLMAKELDIGEPKGVLALAIEPPPLDGIERAILSLKEIGALKLTQDGVLCPDDGDLTFVGKVMCALPLDVKISKLIIYGYIFGCLEDCIIIAASLSFKNFFSKPFEKYLEAYKSRLAWADGSFSDCLAFLYAYKMWQECKRQRLFTRPKGLKEKDWAVNYFIEINRIKEVEKLVREIKERLEAFNITSHPIQRQDDHYNLILRLVIAGAFYPNYFVKQELNERDIYRQVGTKDPCKVVLLTGLPPDQGLLYTQAIENMLKICCPKMKLEFEGTKVLVEFQQPYYQEQGIGPARNHPDASIHSKSAVPAIYLAVKMRHLRMPFVLKTYPIEVGKAKVEELLKLQNQMAESSLVLRTNRITISNSDTELKQIHLPDLDQFTISIYATAVLGCGSFYARYIDEPNTEMHNSVIIQTIKTYKENGFKFLSSPPHVGQLVLAPFNDTPESKDYFRARVESIFPNKEVEVFFVDYGNTEIVEDYKELAEFPDILTNIPALAFPCMLCEIAPSSLGASAGGQWSFRASQYFREQVNNRNLIARVYSVVDGLVKVELFYHDVRGQVSINQCLIDNNFAQKAEEPYASKKDNEARMPENRMSMAVSSHQPTVVAISRNNQNLLDSKVKPTQTTKLHGPFSPLEFSYKGITNITSYRRIKIEPDSVNSVALDSEPQAPRHERLLVACHVGVSQNQNTINLFCTNLMPSVDGLSALLLLIFAPSVELRTNRDRTCYTGALCGLGFDPFTGESLHPDHDAEVEFTVEITDLDISLINSIRMGINLVLDNPNSPLHSEQHIITFQERVRESLNSLLKKIRKPKDPEGSSRPGKWNLIRPEHLLHSDIDREGDNPDILPLIKSVALETTNWKNKMKDHLRDLEKKAGRSPQAELIKCALCNELTRSPRDLLYHLDSPHHLARLQELDLD